MEWFERFYRREKWCKKSVEIESSLYERLKEVSSYELEASVNKIIDACVDDLELPDRVILYKKDKAEINIVRSIIIRESMYEKLEQLRERYDVSIYKLVNIAIKEGLEKYEKSKKGTGTFLQNNND